MTPNPELPENWSEAWSATERREYLEMQDALGRSSDAMVKIRASLPESQWHLLSDVEDAEGEARCAEVSFFEARLQRLAPDRADFISWAFRPPQLPAKEVASGT